MQTMQLRAPLVPSGRLLGLRSPQNAQTASQENIRTQRAKVNARNALQALMQTSLDLRIALIAKW